MAHHTVKQGYRDLVDRINRFPQGAPPSELLYRILEMLFSEREAELVSLLPIRPFTVDRAARVWKMPVDAPLPNASNAFLCSRFCRKTSPRRNSSAAAWNFAPRPVWAPFAQP